MKPNDRMFDTTGFTFDKKNKVKGNTTYNFSAIKFPLNCQSFEWINPSNFDTIDKSPSVYGKCRFRKGYIPMPNRMDSSNLFFT